MSGTKEETALGAARARFLESLPKKAAEVRASVALVAGARSSVKAQEELRRHVRALHGSALIFRVDELARELDQAIGVIDTYLREGKQLDDAALDGLVSALGAFEVEAPSLITSANAPKRMRAATLPGSGPTLAGHSPSDHPTVQGNIASARISSRPPPSSNAVRRAPEAVAIDTVLSILLVGPLATRLSSSLPIERFEVTHAEARDALVKARVAAPDVIIVGDDVVLSAGSQLVRAMRGDPSTDLVPLLLVSNDPSIDRARARERGLDDALCTKAAAGALAEKIARLAGVLPNGRGPELGTITMREAATRMAEELRRGLVDSADRGADELVALGDGTELFAATWSAIARMRTAFVERSGGRVHFRDVERRGGPAWLALGAKHPAPAIANEISLAGRRILVADDDPAVRWFFFGLLEEAGAEVLEAPDGEAALETARKVALDLVITDILMPKLDGLALSRELARDPTTADVPVIFLSWKEDYLQRMRELRASAVGYLRKEEGASVILDAVRDAFRPRLRFESRLRDGGEVRGRIEGLGLLSILRSVGRIRKDARISVRDASNQFEIDLRAGRIVELVRTASDGTFERGRRALASLLGVSAGRFAVAAPVIGARASIEPIGPEAIELEAARLGALVDAVSGKGLALADEVLLDGEVVSSVIQISPPEIVDAIRRLERDKSPRRWLLSGEISPEALSAALIELARRGAVLAVKGDDGEDRVLEALAKRRGVSVEALGHEHERSSEPQRDSTPIARRGVRVEVDSRGGEILEEAEGVVELRSSNRPDAKVRVPEELQSPSDSEGAQALRAADAPLEDVDASDVREVAAEDSAPRTEPRADISRAPRPPTADATVKLVHRLATDQLEAKEPARNAWIVPVGLALVLAFLVGLTVFALRKKPSVSAPSSNQSAERAPQVHAAQARVALGKPPIEDPALYGSALPAAALPRSLAVGKGMLVIEAPAPSSVSVDGVEVGEAPFERAVDAGEHRVEVRLGDDTILRRIIVAEGSGRKLVIR